MNQVKLLHSYSAENVEFLARSDRLVAKLYLLSHPLPGNITKVEIMFISRAYPTFLPANGIDESTEKIFHALTLFRPNTTTSTKDLQFKDDIYQNIQDSIPGIEQQGWTFLPLPKPQYANKSAGVVNLPGKRFDVYNVAFDTGSREDQGSVIPFLQKDDRIAIWTQVRV